MSDTVPSLSWLRKQCRERHIPYLRKSALTMWQLVAHDIQRQDTYSIWLHQKPPLTCHEAQKRIRQWWEKYRFANQTDFITLESISRPYFVLIEDSGRRYRFRAESLYEYFISEGNFIHPYTRRPLNEIELGRLDRVLKKTGTSLSLQTRYREIAQQRAREREHEFTCQFLVNECQQLKTFITDSLQQRHLQHRYVQLVTTVMPRFFASFRQLFLLDAYRASITLDQLGDEFRHMSDQPDIISTPEAYQFISTCILALTQCEDIFFPRIILH